MLNKFDSIGLFVFFSKNKFQDLGSQIYGKERTSRQFPDNLIYSKTNLDNHSKNKKEKEN
jgi:hypothetical protein